jgi:hypothetical protein
MSIESKYSGVWQPETLLRAVSSIEDSWARTN